MRIGLLFFTLISVLVSRGLAGSISGVVQAQGKEGTGGTGASGKYDSRKYKFVERLNYAELRDFVVYIDRALGTNTLPDPAPVQVVTSRKISQKGATFSPHVLPVMAGATVEWPNYDDIFHNVFSISETKQFDLGLYKDPEVKRVIFDKAGRVDVLCSIHKTMNCTILVLQNPHFAVADDSGHFSITNVPPGTYQLKAWHERLPAQSKEIIVPASGDLRVDFVLGITNLPKY